jgi:hypothetical protein
MGGKSKRRSDKTHFLLDVLVDLTINLQFLKFAKLFPSSIASPLGTTRGEKKLKMILLGVLFVIVAWDLYLAILTSEESKVEKTVLTRTPLSNPSHPSTLSLS